jgi:hypothetical protein
MTIRTLALGSPGAEKIKHANRRILMKELNCTELNALNRGVGILPYGQSLENVVFAKM